MPPQAKPRAEASASLDIAASPHALWATFAGLGKWPRWSPIVKPARWEHGPEWTLCATLALELDLPFPVRQWSGIVTLTEIQLALSLAWEALLPMQVAVAFSNLKTYLEVGK